MGGFGPSKRFGVIVVFLETAFDGALRIGYGAEDSVRQALVQRQHPLHLSREVAAPCRAQRA